MRRISALGLAVLTSLSGCSGDDEAGGHFDLDQGSSGPLPECLAPTAVHCQALVSDRPPLECGPGCSVVADLRLDCQGLDYNPTPKLAVIGEDTYMTLRSRNGAGLVRIRGNSWTELTELPCGFERSTDDVLPARGPEDTLWLLTDTHPEETSDGGVTLARLAANQWTHEAVFHVEGDFTPVKALAIAADGSPHAWFAIPSALAHATRPAQGSWTYAVDSADARSWSLSPAGQPVRLLRIGLDDGIRLSAGPSGTDYELAVVEWSTYARLIAPAPESEVAQPEIVALVHRPSALEIHWVDQGAVSSFTIPQSQQLDCDACEEGCVTGFSGIRGSSGYAAARAADGRLWIGWAYDHVDGPIGPMCGEEEDDGIDDSTSTVHLARFDFVTQELEHVIASAQPASDGYEIDMHMHGSRLSLVWTNIEPDNEQSFRLVQLDVLE